MSAPKDVADHILLDLRLNRFIIEIGGHSEERMIERMVLRDALVITVME